MVNNNPEMSLDEVLSSIKKMVIDSEPPVLELTDMVSENGDIVRVKSSTEAKSSDMGSFLKLIQENENSSNEKSAVIPKEGPTQDKRSEFLKSVATSLIQKWISENMPRIAKDIAEREIKKLLSQD